VHILSLTTTPTRKTARFGIQDKGENTGGKKLKESAPQRQSAVDDAHGS